MVERWWVNDASVMALMLLTLRWSVAETEEATEAVSLMIWRESVLVCVCVW